MATLCVLTAGGASAATLASNSAAPSTASPAATATQANAAAAAGAASTDATDATPSGTLSIDGGTTTVQAGTSLTFDYSAATAGSTNWVGVYPQGQAPGDVSSSVWAYAPDATGQVTLSTTGLAAGTYEAWLLYDDGYGEMSAAVTFTVTGAAAPSGTVSVSGNTSVVQGLPLSLSYTADPATASNWIGLYHEGDSDLEDYLTYTYAPDASGTVTFGTAGLAPGTYQADLLYDDGYTALAGPVTFTVTAPPVVPQPVYHATLDGAGKAAFTSPSGVAVDSKGDVWTTDAAKNDVVELSPGGRVLESFGSAGSGNGQLNDPQAIAVSDGDVYVADSGNNRVEEFTTGGQLVATIGGPGTGNGQFTDPEGVAVDSSGDVYVSDTAGNRVEEFGPAGVFIKEITTGMSNPQGLAIDAAGDLWVAQNGMYDTSGDSVIEYSPAGAEIISLGGGNNSNYAGMSNPSDVALDGQGNVYVTEPDYDLVQEFNADGVYEGEFGTPGKDSAGTLYMPSAVAAGSDGQVYVADTGNHRLAEFVPQAAPTVTVQPVPVTVDAGFPAIVHAEASGTPRPSVQWESEAPGATTFAPVTGATSGTLVVPGTTTSQSGTRYEAVFTNATGTATTSAATLTVNALVAPSTPPDHPGGPGSPSWKTWPSAPSWGDIFTWPGVPAWPSQAAGRPAVPAKPSGSAKP